MTRFICWLLMGHSYEYLSLRQAYGPLVIHLRDGDDFPMVRRCRRCRKRQIMRTTEWEDR